MVSTKPLVITDCRVILDTRYSLEDGFKIIFRSTEAHVASLTLCDQVNVPFSINALLMTSEEFPIDPFDPVPLDGVSHPARYSDTQPVSMGWAFLHQSDKKPASNFQRVMLKCLIFQPFSNTSFFGKPLACAITLQW
jgi:hypothetical protein